MMSELRSICAVDFLFYISTFGMLLEPRDKAPWQASRVFGDAREVPFIPRPYQIEYFKKILAAWGNKDIVWLKSREMGATWMVLYLMDWDWRFHSQCHMGMVSKDEESMDSSHNPDALMCKLDFIHAHMPDFLKPRVERNYKDHVLVNLDLESTIVGEACTPNAFRSGRKKLIFMDEMHAYPSHAEYAINASIQYVTHCRVMVSTPNAEKGQGGAFYDACIDEGRDNLKINMHWSLDSDKAAGLYTTGEDNRIVILDKSFENRDKYPYVIDAPGKKRSPYYDWECRRPLATPLRIGCELDMDFGGSSSRFFDPFVIDMMMKDVRDPVMSAVLGREGETGWRPELRESSSDNDILFYEKFPVSVSGRLLIEKDRRFAMGVDISAGVGGSHSSYSAIVVLDSDSGEQVILWRGKTMKPEMLANYCVALGRVLNNALITPEVNGPMGRMFLDQFISYNYPNCYYRESTADSQNRAKTYRIGVNDTDGGERIFGELQMAARRRLVTVRSDIVARECQRYYRDSSGKLRHPLVGRGKDASSEKGHGDAAVACALAWWGIHDMKRRKEEVREQSGPEWGSINWWRGIREKGRFRKSYWKESYSEDEREEDESFGLIDSQAG
jgi:hypothetical protein